MKKISLVKVIMAVAFLATAFPASAQGEWKWANYWTGNDDPLSSTNPYNYVVRTAFDDDGNIYVFGNFGGNARLYDQNQSNYLINIASIAGANTPGTVLAKFDTMGNLLWEKNIKGSHDNSCLPYDMYLKNDRIIIAGEYSWEHGANKQLWFIDTLITQQVAQTYPSSEHNPPFTFGTYTYFVYFDLDGNKLESHFVKTKSRELYLDQQMDFPLGRRIIGNYPLCIDNQGNTYIAVSTQYGGIESSPYTVVIDEDSSKTYNIFLPGNCGSAYLNNIMVYKFSPNWELAWMRLVVNHTEGVAPALPYDSINPEYRPYVGGLNIDNNDNLYLSGYIADMFMYDEYHQYPMKFFWDSTHFATVSDHGLAHYLPFIIKYDADGNVQWANQAFVSNPSNSGFYNKTIWTDNCIKGQSVYLMGYAELLDGLSADYSFGDESNTVPITQYSSFFVRFNKDNGAFESCGVVPGEKTTLDLGKSSLPAVTNNHFLGVCRNYYNNYYLLNYFNIDGTFDRADTVWYTSKNHSAKQGVAVNDDGNILCNVVTNQDLSFGHDLTLNFDDHQHSHAVIAYRSDPSILEPYPEDSTAVPQYDERLSEIRLYPNPATDRVVIESPEGLPVGMVAVTNESGQLLFLQPATSCRTELSVRNLPAGLYVAHVSTSVGSTAIKFVVKR